MDERRKINLHQHTLPPVSKRYLIKIIVYIGLLCIVGLLIYQVGFRLKPKKQNIEEVEMIKKINLDQDSYRN